MPLKYSPKIHVTFILYTIYGEEKSVVSCSSNTTLKEAFSRTSFQISEAQRERVKIVLEGLEGKVLSWEQTLGSLGLQREIVLQVTR